MPTDPTDPTAAAEWLAAYLDMKLPDDQLAAAVRTTQRVAAAMTQRAGALAMEDEPADFTAALERLAVPR
jgi:hypothetical protein